MEWLRTAGPLLYPVFKHDSLVTEIGAGLGARWVGVWGVRAVGERVAGRGLACGVCVRWVCLGCEGARAAGASLNAMRGSRFVRVLGCAGASRPLVRVLRVLHVVLGVRRCLGARGKVK